MEGQGVEGARTEGPGREEPRELVRRCEAALLALPSLRGDYPAHASGLPSSGPSPREGEAGAGAAAEAEARARVQALRRLLLGDAGALPDAAAVEAAAGAAFGSSLLEALVTRLPALHWEGRKEVALVWAALLPHQDPASQAGHDQTHPAGGDQTHPAGESPGVAVESGGQERARGELQGAPEAASGPREGGSVHDEDGISSSRRPLHPGLQLLERRLDLVDALVLGCSASNDLALHAGLMLRETLRSPLITRHVLQTGLSTILGCCDVPNFDVASDAFTTVKDLLRRHKKTAAGFLEDNYAQFLGMYHNLLMSDTYVTRRQAVKLLGELLLDRANMAVMLRYISEKDNLKLIMTLLKDPSKSIQYEAFHIFKVFVANPKRPEDVSKLLRRNQFKLLKFLHDFDIGKEEEEFEEEKEMLIGELENLDVS